MESIFIAVSLRGILLRENKALAFDAESSEQLCYSHSFLAGKLQGCEVKVSVGKGNLNVGLAVGEHGSGALFHFAYLFLGLIDLYCCCIAFGIGEFCPCCGVGRKSSYKVVECLAAFVPVYAAGVAENLGRRTQFSVENACLCACNSLAADNESGFLLS